jgi:hypothetical protein
MKNYQTYAMMFAQWVFSQSIHQRDIVIVVAPIWRSAILALRQPFAMDVPLGGLLMEHSMAVHALLAST